MRQIKRNIVERLISETGLSAHAWAIQHGFAPQTVNAWIHGVRNIGGRNLMRLADALRVEPEEICSVIFKVDKNRLTNFEKLSLIEKQTEKLCCIYRILNDYQREKILSWAEAMKEQNELKARKEWGLNEQ